MIKLYNKLLACATILFAVTILIITLFLIVDLYRFSCMHKNFLQKTNFELIRGGCVQIIEDLKCDRLQPGKYVLLGNGKLSQKFPKIISDLKPMYLYASQKRIAIEFRPVLAPFGEWSIIFYNYDSIQDFDKEKNEIKLCKGLWYSEEEFLFNKEYRISLEGKLRKSGRIK